MLEVIQFGIWSANNQCSMCIQVSHCAGSNYKNNPCDCRNLWTITMPGASHTHLLLFFRRSSPRRELIFKHCDYLLTYLEGRSSLRLPLESNRVAHSDTRTDDTNEVVWRVNSVRERGVAGLIGSVARFLQVCANCYAKWDVQLHLLTSK